MLFKDLFSQRIYLSIVKGDSKRDKVSDKGNDKVNDKVSTRK